MAQDLRATCQCCGRDIGCKRGRIAHHGYKRPSGGWQTASCMGAGAAPFELSRDRLGDLLAQLRAYIVKQREALTLINNDADGLELSLVISTERNHYGLPKPTYIRCTRETFAAQKLANAAQFSRHRLYDWAAMRAREEAAIRGQISGAVMELAILTAAYDDWVPPSPRRLAGAILAGLC